MVGRFDGVLLGCASIAVRLGTFFLLHCTEFSFGAIRAMPYLGFDLDYLSIDAPPYIGTSYRAASWLHG